MNETREQIIAELDAQTKALAKMRGMTLEVYLKRYPEMNPAVVGYPEWCFYPQVIDTSKQYKTKSGKQVVCIDRTERNSQGHRVTYPIGGSVVLREKPLKMGYQIWSEKGERIVGETSPMDLDLESGV